MIASIRRFKRWASLAVSAATVCFLIPTLALGDSLDVALCKSTADVILDAGKARDAGVPEASYLSHQGVNATDDIEKELVYLVYHDRDIPIKMLRDNVFKACVATDQWSNCKPLTRKTGIACIPP